MADVINTGGGASVDGSVGTGGGAFTGRDSNSANVVIHTERNVFDDLRTDLRFIKEDIEDLKFVNFELRGQIETLKQESRNEISREDLVKEQRRTNALLQFLVALIICVVIWQVMKGGL